MTTFQTSFDFNMKTNILIILKMPFLILDMMLVLVWVNYFGNLSWQYKQVIHVSCKTWNHPQTTQTTHKASTNQPNQSHTSQTTHETNQTTYKLAKPPTNHPQTSWATHEPTTPTIN